jgi:hypothetical protein
LLKLHVDDHLLLFPWDTVRTADADLRKLHCCIIEKDGLWTPSAISPPTSQGDLATPFLVVSGKFGAPLVRGDFHPSVRCFISILKRAGVYPEFQRQHRIPHFSLLFDISSKTHRAYYALNSLDFGEDATQIITEVYCNPATPEVVANARHLDATLHTLIRLCNIPEVRR